MKAEHCPRILLLTTGAGIGGMERAVINLTRQLRSRGCSVQSVFPKTPTSEVLLKWCREQGVDVQTTLALQEGWAPHGLHAIQALHRFVRMTHPDVVNLHYGTNWIALKDIIAVRLTGRRRCFVTIHGPELSLGLESLDRRKVLLTRIAALLCHGIIVPSRASRATLLQAGVPFRKVHVIPYGLHVPERVPVRSVARAQLNLLQDAFVIGSHARLIPNKGIGDLIDAVARIPDPTSNLRLVVAGDGPERAALAERAATRLGSRAVFLGHLTDPTSFYAATDVFALPSHSESFGIVYAEAAMVGVPSIGTNVGGIPDAIIDGETGLLVRRGDHTALATAIERLRDDPNLRAQMGKQAQARANMEFTEERMADRYVQVYQQGRAR